MNQSDFDELREAPLRRALTASQQAELETWLAAHPDARQVWAEEQAFRRVLGQLPDVAVSPQFTARVVAAAERFDESLGRSRGGSWIARWQSLLLGWRGAVAATGMVAVVISLSVYQQGQARARLAESVAAMSALAELPDLEALAEFELVYHLPSGPLPDVQELARAFE